MSKTAEIEEVIHLISQLNTTIVTSKNFSEIGDKIVEILSPKIPIDWMSICIIKEDKVCISSLSSKFPSHFEPGEDIPLSGTATEYVMKTGEILYNPDLSKTQKFWTEKYHYKRGIRCILRLPLFLENKVFATWVIASKKPNVYTEKDIKLLKLISYQISAPLKLFLLYEETKKHVELFKIIDEFLKILFSDIEINIIFEKFVEKLKKYIPFERLSIGIVEKDHIKYVAVSEMIKTGRLEGVKIPLKFTASGWVIKNKKTLIRNDLLKEAEFELEKVKIKQGIRATMHVPIIYKNKILGTINFSSVNPGTYTEKEKQIIEVLMPYISPFLAISYLYSPFYNHLTEVYNRRYFDIRIEEELKISEKYGKSFCISLCDLDNFKNFNDSYGHIEGDKCLREVAKTIEENVRNTDLVFRYGGDEFAILMPNVSLKTAVNVMRRVKNIIKEKFKSKGITISVGIASYPLDGKTRTEIIDTADKRLPKAKKRKNLIVFS